MSGAATAEFARMLDEHRGEIRRHCYRMLGSLEDAEDVTQETLLRAWRAWDSFAGRSSFRTWVYRIATNACFDHLRRASRRPAAEPSEFAKVPAQVAVPWLQPYPEPSDAASLEPAPDQRAVARETIRLAFVAAVQYLPPRQRGAFLLRDCLGWPIRECADALGSSTAAVNSALQRARATMRSVLDEDPAKWTGPRPGVLRSDEKALVDRYVEAIETADDSRIAALFAADAKVSHAPRAGGSRADAPVWYSGRQTIVAAWYPVLHGDGHPELLLLPIRMNAQPGVATYLRMPGEDSYDAFALAALAVADDQVIEVATFHAELFEWFGLPVTARDHRHLRGT